MKILVAIALVLASMSAHALDCTHSPLNHDEKRLLGGTENICQSYGGQVILVVNTASHCGYTPQYEGLERLYKTYHSKGFVILGFPSNEFLQEWDEEGDIASFCTTNYGVSFPMYGKTKVLGDDADLFYKDLRAATGSRPTWNFNKYLIGRDGKSITHFSGDVTPDDPELIKAIEAKILVPMPADSPALTQPDGSSVLPPLAPVQPAPTSL